MGEEGNWPFKDFLSRLVGHSWFGRCVSDALRMFRLQILTWGWLCLTETSGQAGSADDLPWAGKGIYTWHSTSSWIITSELLRYGTCSQGISQFYLHAHTFNPQLEWAIPAFNFTAIASRPVAPWMGMRCSTSKYSLSMTGYFAKQCEYA